MNLELIVPVAFGAGLVILWIAVLIKNLADSQDSSQTTDTWKKCMICQEAGNDIIETVGYNEQYYFTHRYHMACVMDVVCDPSRFNEWQVDQALAIVKARRTHREKQKEYDLAKIKKRLVQKSECRKACKELHDV